ncbi:MAG TPA: FkbM family methyltransferase [Terracidiphilus sp.]|nr:FkbM family methyltransferase [Terracidiphilus sp.]
MKGVIQYLANALGYEVHKLSFSAPRRRLAVMQRLGINFVLDVGANGGYYASSLRRGGYKGRIWSYEPQHEAFASLDKSAASDPLWKAINSGCGAKASNAKINVAKNSHSSSLLPMLGVHSANAPESMYVSQEAISLCSLDDSVIPSLKLEDKVWLKIDTQGYEGEVLKGATSLMPHVSALECELSLVPLYEGQLLIDEMITLIYQMGFRMIGLSPVFSEPETGFALQIDGTFLRM